MRESESEKTSSDRVCLSTKRAREYGTKYAPLNFVSKLDVFRSREPLVFFFFLLFFVVLLILLIFLKTLNVTVKISIA